MRRQEVQEGWQDIVHFPDLHDSMLHLVSTVNTFDRGWETMIFPAHLDHTTANWRDVFSARHDTAATALNFHNHILVTRTLPPLPEED